MSSRADETRTTAPAPACWRRLAAACLATTASVACAALTASRCRPRPDVAFPALAVGSTVWAPAAGAPQTSPVAFVNLFAGVSPANRSFSEGNTLPLVARPWGFNAWTLQTVAPPSDAWPFQPADTGTRAGRDTAFHGVRCTHQPSPWIGDYGYFLFTPLLGDGRPGNAHEGFTWSAPSATAQPHLFSSILGTRSSAGVWAPPDLEGMRVRLDVAPTSRAAVFRMKYLDDAAVASAKHAYFRFDVSADREIPLVSAARVSRNEINITAAGGACTSPRCAEGFRMFLHVEFSVPIEGHAVHSASEGARGAFSWLGAEPNAVTVRLPTRVHGHEVTVGVGVSFISPAQARLNLKREVAGRAVEEVAAEGLAEWERILGAVHLADVGPSMAPENSRASLVVWNTALYRTALFPRFLHEVDAEGKAVHYSPYTGERALPGVLVGDSGFWDAHRTVYPFLSLPFPHREVLGEMLQGWLNAAAENGGEVPQWASPGVVRCLLCGVTMSDATIADALAKGIGGFDEAQAMRTILESAESGTLGDQSRGRGLPGRLQRRLGFVPARRGLPSVSFSLDQYRADAAVAGAARALCARGVAKDASCTAFGKYPGSLAAELDRRAGRFPALFDAAKPRAGDGDAAKGVHRARARGGRGSEAFSAGGTMGAFASRSGGGDGGVWPGSEASLSFQPHNESGFVKRRPMDAWAEEFVEGTPWHYRFYVPHNVTGLDALYDGRLCDTIASGLGSKPPEKPRVDHGEDELMSGGLSSGFWWDFDEIHESREARHLRQKGFGFYAHNNQPVHHWLYVMLTAPDRRKANGPSCAEEARAWIRRVLTELYPPGGYAGDEDNGEMTAWYLLSAMGLYPLRLGTDELVLGAPLFARVEVRVARDRVLTISRRDRAPHEGRVDALWNPYGSEKATPLAQVVSYRELLRGGSLTFLV